MYNLIKMLFCKHEYEFISNLYGDQIIYHGFNRSVWKCKKCGEYEYKPYLVEENDKKN